MKRWKKTSVTAYVFLCCHLCATAQISITSDFDTGSLGRIRRTETSSLTIAPNRKLQTVSLDLLSRSDPRNPIDTALLPGSRWFHFRIEGAKDRLLLLHIPNSEIVRPFYSYDGENYRRMEPAENLFPQTVQKYFRQDTVYIAYFIPYSHARHTAKASRWSRSPFVQREEIGRSGENRPIELLTLTDPAVPDSMKRRVWMHARVHPGEAPAAWHLEAIVEELLSDNPLARELRRHTVFYIVPEPNPDGVIGGYSRSTASGINLEINWNRPDSLTAPEVGTLKSTIGRLTARRPLDVVLNLHSQSAPFTTYWIHTANSTSPAMYRRKMLFSALTIHHTPYYRPVDQRFSEAAPHYVEGWLWRHFGEQTLAVTFETPYTYYNNDPRGETWVSQENLTELARSSLLALSDLLDLGGSERLRSDAETMKTRGTWSLIKPADQQFFGLGYLVADRQGATVAFRFEEVQAGRYDIYKWIPGPLGKQFSAATENCWSKIGETEQKKTGRMTWRYRAAGPGDVLDAILLVRKREPNRPTENATALHRHTVPK